MSDKRIENECKDEKENIVKEISEERLPLFDDIKC